MKTDFDKFYDEEWADLKPRIIEMLDAYEAGKLMPKAAALTPGLAPIIVAPALPGKEGAKELLQSGQSLDTVGASLGITRVTKASGHGFDEEDASYKKRLLCEIVGATAADMEIARMAAETPAQVAAEDPPRDDKGLRTDGPTIKEWVDRNYPARNYPPSGYASKSTPEEIAAAVAAEENLDAETAAKIEAKKREDAEKAAASEAAAAAASAAAAAKTVETGTAAETGHAPAAAGSAAPPT